MSIETDCIAWWKLEDLAAEIGPVLINPNAVTFVPTKFNDGAYSNAAANWLYSTTTPGFTPNAYIVEQWIKTDVDYNNGVPVGNAAATYFEWWHNNDERLILYNDGTQIVFGCKIGAAWNFFNSNNAAFTWTAGDLVHLIWVKDRNGIGGGANIRRIYVDGLLADSSNAAIVNQANVGNQYRICSIGGAWPLLGSTDNIKAYNTVTEQNITDIISNMNNEAWPSPAPPDIVETDLNIKRPKVYILNSGVELFAEGLITKLKPIIEKKTFQRDKIQSNKISFPVINTTNQFNPDNPNSIFSGINWRYQPCLIDDEDDNRIWTGIIDDMPSDENTKLTKIESTDSLAKFFQTKIEYESDDWETPGDSFKNICDNYNYTNYQKKYLEASIAQYEDNNCYIWCHFKLADNVTFQQALEKIAKFGAADCYSANNLLNFKLWMPFTGGVKFNISESDLKKNIKSKLSRAYYNDYIIGYNGDLDIPTKDVDNNYIGEVSVDKNDPHTITLDGGDNQQIEIKDKTSAIFLGEQHIRRSHINLSTRPFPPLIINFSLGYKHKDFINLQTWFRLTNEARGWDDKLFEVYINQRDYGNQLLNLTAYEVDE